MLAILSVASAAPLATEEQQLASLLVSDRGQRRERNRMTPDPILSAVARARAEDMAKRRYFSHVNPEGVGPNALVRAAGYALPAAWPGRSENFIESIGAGYATAEAAWDGWMHSAAHRTHLLASSAFYRDQTKFGIGSYADPASPFRRYWVVITAPPSSHGEGSYVSRRASKISRVAGLMPVLSDVDPDEGRLIDWEAAPHPTAPRPREADKLWNWDDAPAAPRPAATRSNGAG